MKGSGEGADSSRTEDGAVTPQNMDHEVSLSPYDIQRPLSNPLQFLGKVQKHAQRRGEPLLSNVTWRPFSTQRGQLQIT